MCFYSDVTKTCKLLLCFAMDGQHSWWDTDRRCHVCESLWWWHHSWYRNTVTDVFIRSSTFGLRWLLIQPNQMNICPLRVRNKMFIHVSLNVLAFVYNTVIVAKSHLLCSISHTTLHIFKSLLRCYLNIIKMSLAVEPCWCNLCVPCRVSRKTCTWHSKTFATMCS